MTGIKSANLDMILSSIGSAVVAFSGGVDSTFLLYRADRVNHSGIIAATIRTPYIPSREINEAVDFAAKYGIKHKIFDIPFPEGIRNNPAERCYLCKKRLFTELVTFASENKYNYVIDGTNADDSGDYRPGMKALDEMGVRSPLMEAGLAKSDIRELARQAGLDIWEKPAMACLLTRIPHDTLIDERILRMIEHAENIMSDYGFPGTRVRIHGDIARIECPTDYFERIIHNPDREHIIMNLKKEGFRYISLDLEGYRQGSLNSEIEPI
jgi:pyridinium-3,5-biscarboxylic acid mononucleotide sulfurtransferase